MKVRRDLQKLAELFMNENELRQLPKGEIQRADYFYKLWCAKEALYKALPLHEQAQTSLSSISYQAILGNSSPWHLIENVIDDYRVAILSERTDCPTKLIESPVELD
ncbi:hypothetical protein GCM10011352_03470 [Marinobacterium zhoushanense]|uniref:4'-phosphopantetheinyl transferase domain-containing protein n=2 Tax=Marinobacterium zhoushanense TaxID=1679163 RepID=A0ABQ1JXF0_9GAMM|nr:hypothetical protein GCM10011352_03470 [Marinobacterium zhoushanense]